jgi:transposase
VTAAQARIATLEATLTPVAERLPAYPLLRSIPGVGATVAAVLLAEIGDIGWFTKFSQLRKLAGLDIVRVQSGQYAGQQRISKCGRGLLRWALYHAAVGAARTAVGRTRLAAYKAKRGRDRFAGFKAIVELAAKQLRIIWGVWRSGTPYDPTRAGGLRRQAR